MSVDAKTIAIYDERVGDYADAFSKHEQHKPHLDAFCVLLPDAGHVLDFGCGPGAHARAMQDRGYIVSAFDASEQMVRLSRENGVDAYVATFADFDAKQTYDGIWANFSLLHAERKDMQGHIRAIHTGLKQNGIFHIGLKTGHGEMRDGIGRRYAYYSVTELNELVSDIGFSVLSSKLGQSAGLDGTVAPWVVMLCRRND